MKIVAVLNPVSGNSEFNIRELVLEKFSDQDFQLFESQCPGHATEITKLAVESGAEAVIAVGGDGTIMEVIQGLIGTNAKLGIIPFGTGNMLALNLGISLDVERSIGIIMSGSTRKIDIGKINNHYFAFMAGCGFDASIIEETSREKKKRFGMFAYYIEGIRQAFKSRKASFKIVLDSKKTVKLRAISVIIANSANIIGNIFTLAPNSSIMDGYLDIIVISPRGAYDYIPTLWNIITKQPVKNVDRVKYYKAKSIEIKSKPTLLVQADGELIEKTPVKVTIIPACIEIFSPENIEESMSRVAQEHLKSIINTALAGLKINVLLGH